MAELVAALVWLGCMTLVAYLWARAINRRVAAGLMLVTGATSAALAATRPHGLQLAHAPTMDWIVDGLFWTIRLIPLASVAVGWLAVRDGERLRQEQRRRSYRPERDEYSLVLGCFVYSDPKASAPEVRTSQPAAAPLITYVVDHFWQAVFSARTITASRPASGVHSATVQCPHCGASVGHTSLSAPEERRRLMMGRLVALPILIAAWGALGWTVWKHPVSILEGLAGYLACLVAVAAQSFVFASSLDLSSVFVTGSDQPARDFDPQSILKVWKVDKPEEFLSPPASTRGARLPASQLRLAIDDQPAWPVARPLRNDPADLKLPGMKETDDKMARLRRLREGR